MLDEVIPALVADVEAGWTAAGHRWEALAEVATAALERARVHEAIDIDRLWGELSTATRLAAQTDPGSSFGEPPVTLARGVGFHVDAYLWVQPATSIHDHGFCGAYTILEGQSLHTTFDFDLAERFVGPSAGREEVRLGELRVRRAELLGPGAVRAIPPGRALVHQSAHLSLPSLTLAIRTTDTDRERLQFEYLPPGVATRAGLHLDPLQRRQLEVALVLVRSGRPDVLASLTPLVGGASPLLTALLLRSIGHHCMNVPLARALAERSPHPFADEVVDAAARALDGAIGVTLVASERARLEQLIDSHELDAPTRARLLAEYARATEAAA